jgi:hypothetical protein
MEKFVAQEIGQPSLPSSSLGRGRGEGLLEAGEFSDEGEKGFFRVTLLGEREVFR